MAIASFFRFKPTGSARFPIVAALAMAGTALLLWPVENPPLSPGIHPEPTARPERRERAASGTPTQPDEIPFFLTMGKPLELSIAKAQSIASGLRQAVGTTSSDTEVSRLLEPLAAVHLGQIDQLLTSPSSPADARHLLWTYWIQRCPDSAKAYAAIHPDHQACYRMAAAAYNQALPEATLRALTNHSP
jgi:hypothetical protein